MTMNTSVLTSNLRDSEEVLAVVRRSPLSHIKGFVFSVILIIAAFFFLFPLLRMGRWGLLIILVALVVGIFVLIRTIVLFRMNVLVLTSERVLDIDQQGLFTRVVSECLYENIQEMSIHIHGVLGTTFRVGTLMIHTIGGRADLKVSGIANPQKVQEVVSRIQKKMQTGASSDSLSADELVQLLEKIKKNVDLSAFAKRQLHKSKHDED